jgi:hypothetical protein
MDNVNFDEMSNNEILFGIKKLQAEHESLKIKMIKDYDNLVELEKEFTRANEIIQRRLKGK